MNEQETINTELFTFPPPTEKEQTIARNLIKSGTRDIQKPLEIFTAVIEQVAEKISSSPDEHGRYRPNYFHTSIFCYSWAAHLSLLGLSGLPPVGKELRELLYARLWFSLDNAVLQSALFRFTQSIPAAYHILTEQNATDIFDKIRIEAHATPEAKDFVIRHVYAILCEMDGMPRYLTGECHLTKEE